MRRLVRCAPFLAPALLLVPAIVWARVGGGEHYTSSSEGDDSGGGDGFAFLFRILIELAFRYPKVGVPLLIIAVVGYVYVQKNNNPTARTQRAFQKLEAEKRTQVGAQQVGTWTAQLQSKDPAFDLNALYGRASKLFVDVQEAWFRRNLEPVRPLLSDATWQRLSTQLQLLHKQGIRDAITQVKVNDVTLIAVEQNPSFDIVHLRFRAQARDTDVPATATDEEALRAAANANVDTFVEVWTFVRKPGATTKAGQDVSVGKCPNCGAPFTGGATNTCQYCNAVVNSGNYDWVLSEITQGSEYQPYKTDAGALREVRENDPALSTEALEDRASLIFWKWITAHADNQPAALAKLASSGFLAQLGDELGKVAQANKRRVFLECAVGAVNSRSVLPNQDGHDEAAVEIRWSAKMAFVAPGQPLPKSVPPTHQRSVFVLTRLAGAKTRAENGMATSRCPTCNAPLTDTLTPTCDFCGSDLSSGAGDWVLAEALSLEAWNARQWTRRQSAARGQSAPKIDVADVQERERLLAMMAALAAADGQVDAKERELLKLCATRWSVPWQNVEYALSHGADSFDRLVPRGGPEAEAFLRAVIQMAKVDGKVDRKERRLLQDAARHLGLTAQLEPMLRA